jgi:hypothetical protein
MLPLRVRRGDRARPVLPTPEELRERSFQFRDAARKALDHETKRRFAADAFILA